MGEAIDLVPLLDNLLTLIIKRTDQEQTYQMLFLQKWCPLNDSSLSKLDIVKENRFLMLTNENKLRDYLIENVSSVTTMTNSSTSDTAYVRIVNSLSVEDLVRLLTMSTPSELGTSLNEMGVSMKLGSRHRFSKVLTRFKGRYPITSSALVSGKMTENTWELDLALNKHPHFFSEQEFKQLIQTLQYPIPSLSVTAAYYYYTADQHAKDIYALRFPLIRWANRWVADFKPLNPVRRLPRDVYEILFTKYITQSFDVEQWHKVIDILTGENSEEAVLPARSDTATVCLEEGVDMLRLENNELKQRMQQMEFKIEALTSQQSETNQAIETLEETHRTALEQAEQKYETLRNEMNRLKEILSQSSSTQQTVNSVSDNPHSFANQVRGHQYQSLPAQQTTSGSSELADSTNINLTNMGA